MKRLIQTIIITLLCTLTTSHIQAQNGVIVYSKDTLCFSTKNLISISHDNPTVQEISLACVDTLITRKTSLIDSIGFMRIPDCLIIKEELGEWSEMRICKDGTLAISKTDDKGNPLEIGMFCPDDSLGVIAADIKFDVNSYPIEMTTDVAQYQFEWLNEQMINITIIAADSILLQYDSIQIGNKEVATARIMRVPNVDEKPGLVRLGGVIEAIGGVVGLGVGTAMVLGSGLAEIGSVGSSTPISLPGLALGTVAINGGLESIGNGLVNAFSNNLYVTGWNPIRGTLGKQAISSTLEKGVIPRIPDQYFSFLVDPKYNTRNYGWWSLGLSLAGQIISNLGKPYTWADLVRDIHNNVLTGIVMNCTATSATIRGYIGPYILESPNGRFETEYGIGVYSSVDAKERLRQSETNGNGGMIEYTFGNLKPGTKYYYYTYYIDKTNERSAVGEIKSFTTKSVPVITEFKVTNSTYEAGAFTNDGQSYDYKFDVSVTVSIDATEAIDDWGYVYRAPDGRTKEISLKGFGSTYTDTRYAYFRNENPSTCTLYGYVKYAGDGQKYYGETIDFPLEHAFLTCPDENHPHVIDLGLPSGTLWACCNVGASTPEGYGNYYAWGETSPKSYYGPSTYQFAVQNDNGFWYDDATRKHYSYTNIGSDIAGTGYDAATANWGSPWHMPTKAQCDELSTYCSSAWTTQNGANGRKFTGQNGVTIFLPAAGSHGGSGLNGAGSVGHYWSSTNFDLYQNFQDYAWGINFSSSGVETWSCGNCYYGHAVRPVR